MAKFVPAFTASAFAHKEDTGKFLAVVQYSFRGGGPRGQVISVRPFASEEEAQDSALQTARILVREVKAEALTWGRETGPISLTHTDDVH